MPSICPLSFGPRTHHLSVKALHNLHNTPEAADKDQVGNARPLVKSAVKGCATGAAPLVGCFVSYQNKLSPWPCLYCWSYPLPSPPLPMRFKLCSVISVPPYLLPTKTSLITRKHFSLVNLPTTPYLCFHLYYCGDDQPFQGVSFL